MLSAALPAALVLVAPKSGAPWEGFHSPCLGTRIRGYASSSASCGPSSKAEGTHVALLARREHLTPCLSLSLSLSSVPDLDLCVGAGVAWMTRQQDEFWSLERGLKASRKKQACELAHQGFEERKVGGWARSNCVKSRVTPRSGV